MTSTQPPADQYSAELQETQKPAEGSGKEGSGICPKILIGSVVCLLVLLVVGYFVIVNVVSGMAKDQFLKIDENLAEEYCQGNWSIQNMTDNIWWPGCGQVRNGDFSNCKGTCIKTSTMRTMSAFNSKLGGKLVSYKSRRDTNSGPNPKPSPAKTIKLIGWLLLAPNHTATTPRIVLQHGFTSNSNKHRTQFFAYQLRKIGFSVLVNNFRDHCYSDDTKERINQWGHACPYDTLGAWDYAVKDPDNVFGGPIDDKYVGVMGFSKGGFTSASLFGLESRVPAIWVDAPPFTPKTGFAVGLQNTLAGMGLGFLSFIVDPVYNNMVEAAKEVGVDINANTPADTLPQGPDTKRPIFWVGNKDDTTVAYADGAKLLAVLEKYPKKYDVREWHTEGACNGLAHCEDHIRIPEQYEAKLCTFWTGVFQLKESTCGLENNNEKEEKETDNEKTERRLQLASVRQKAHVVV